ncbi:MAG: All-trans-zeta-carotene desaturase [Chroococcidiopsis sp. SAG 2025]|uniref:phytoene desaturase family protein n=1 Tax=Chroococcidiopsis sp. SAG 2025 TaxID=171389 RepID=UPI0029371554|nr:phytoene desaturase family protein [Chroococcidiopsis sp. SAG 2025]MDV2997934.1 All-trans-zeta-carotene desaturase [Chroococcidiopsis sp. SAG 2025]
MSNTSTTLPILQLPHLYEDLFREVGLNFADYVQLKRLEPYTRVQFWDGTQLNLTSDLESFKTQLATLRSDLPLAFERWYTEHIRKYKLGYKPYLGSPARTLSGYLRWNEIMPLLSFRPWESLYQHFWRFFQDERLVYALSYPSKYLGMHPTVAASVFSLIPFLEFAQGVWHPVGGFRALAQGLAKAAQDLGVQIQLNCRVHQVWIEQGQVRGIELADGKRLNFDAVVINADFGYAIRHLLPTSARGRYTDRKLKQMKFSCSTFMLYLGVNRRYEDLAHHQIYLSEHIRRRERPWLDDSGLDETDPPFYVCNPSIIDPSNAPVGHSTLFVLVPIPNTSYAVDWHTKQKSYQDFIIKRLHLLGYDNIEQHIVAQGCYTAQTWRDDYQVHLGAVFNLSHNWSQLGPFRPPIRFENISRLYWIGGAVHPGSGLLTILEAARSASGFISQDLA